MKEKQRALRTPDSDARRRAPIVVQRKCGCGGSCGPCADEKKKKKVQRHALGETNAEVPRSVENILGSAGHPLDADTRASMESRFGRSLADVRVHTDTHAAESAKEINAAAYTSGTHIVFGAGRFAPHTASGRRLLAHELAHVMQQRSGTALPTGIGPADDAHERAADRVADLIAVQGPAFAPPPVILPIAERLVRRKREDEEPATGEEEAHRLIVEDCASPAAGQMRRKEFVALLDAAICETSRQEMGRLGRSTDGCPLLEQWRPRIRTMSTRQLEISIRRWIEPDAQVRNARAYIPRISERLAESIRIWGRTGGVSHIPRDLVDLLAPGKIKLSVGSMIKGAIGSLFRKSRDGAPAPATNVALDASAGRPLDTNIASRMGQAFGRDFSGVRVHTDADAASAAASVNARAFTIGNEIAFAPGEYAPGTLIGDALLAHELAHVVQQDGAEGVMTKSDAATTALEHDADDAAVGAVVSLWPKLRHWARDVRANAMPRLKSSLQLQSCDPTMAEKRGYLGGIDVANKPLTAGDSAKRARFVVKDWKEASPEFLLTIRRKILIIRQLLANGPSEDDEQRILDILERTEAEDLEVILSNGAIRHSELLDKFDDKKTELWRFYMRRYPDAFPGLDHDVFGQREEKVRKPDPAELAKATPSPIGTVQFGDELPATTNPFKVRTDRQTAPMEYTPGRDKARQWAVEVYKKYIPADAITRASKTSITYDPGDMNKWVAFLNACMRTASQAVCEALEPGTAAFYDRSSNSIDIHSKRDSATTMLHEVMHALSHENTQKLAPFAVEGLTEFFTRRVVLKRKWSKGEKPLVLGGHYDPQYDAIQELAIVVGEDLLANVYFKGENKALCDALGKAKFDAWSTEMERRTGAPDATKILRGATPVKAATEKCS